ncbi:unnamed protein product [Cuscuta europaea]|uniref:Uncharacterized protein n=1 Tax=Cuscuta europaea TaxID=41803 RepID=A0A9P0YVH1_CUSEU|nr:unnamed protein product [Cuscuta europaea]
MKLFILLVLLRYSISGIRDCYDRWCGIFVAKRNMSQMEKTQEKIEQNQQAFDDWVAEMWSKINKIGHQPRRRTRDRARNVPSDSQSPKVSREKMEKIAEKVERGKLAKEKHTKSKEKVEKDGAKERRTGLEESQTVSHSRKDWRGKLGKLAEKVESGKVEKEKRSTLEKDKRSNMEKETSSKPEKEKSSNLEKGKPKLRQKCRRRGRSRTVHRFLNSKSKYPSQSQDTSSGPLVLTRADKSSSKSLFEFPESQQNLVIQQHTYGEEEFSDKPSVNLEPEDGTVGFSRSVMFSKYDLDQSDLETNRFKLLHVCDISSHLAQKRNWPNVCKTEMMYRQSSNIVLEGLNIVSIVDLVLQPCPLGASETGLLKIEDIILGNSCLERKRSGPVVLKDRVHLFSWESYAIIQIGVVMISHGGLLNWREGVSRRRLAKTEKGAEIAVPNQKLITEKHLITMFQAILKPKIEEGLSNHYNSRDHQYYSPVVSFVLVNLKGRDPSTLDSSTNLWVGFLTGALRISDSLNEKTM